MGLPDIVITSFLGKTRAKRKLRLSYHLRQREELARVMPSLRIVTYASNYSDIEATQLRRYEVRHFDRPMKKWELQNIVLRKLYAIKGRLNAVLFLDDDVIPRPLKDGEAEAGLVNTADLIRDWIESPSQVGGQIAYFATAGLRFDAYWKSSNYIVGPAPPTVVSWAMFIRNDLNVLYTRDLVEDEKTGLHDDLPFRIKCWAEGKTVIKHARAFWKSFQPTVENKQASTSSWFESQEERLETNRLIKAKMLRMFPDFFKRGKAKLRKPIEWDPF